MAQKWFLPIFTTLLSNLEEPFSNILSKTPNTFEPPLIKVEFKKSGVHLGKSNGGLLALALRNGFRTSAATPTSSAHPNLRKLEESLPRGSASKAQVLTTVYPRGTKMRRMPRGLNFGKSIILNQVLHKLGSTKPFSQGHISLDSRPNDAIHICIEKTSEPPLIPSSPNPTLPQSTNPPPSMDVDDKVSKKTFVKKSKKKKSKVVEPMAEDKPTAVTNGDDMEEEPKTKKKKKNKEKKQKFEEEVEQEKEAKN
ncbi:hypothetical protein LguiA_011015 [Lonicera macranthoides]